MCEPPVVRFTMNIRGSLPEFSQNARGNYDSENQLGLVDELKTGCSCKSEVSNPIGEAGRPMTCNRTFSNNSYRCQLEQDVQKLQQLLHEEMELHAVLENAVEHAAVTLSDLSFLPSDVQELLCNITALDVTVSKLEQEMVSLHFQLIQERNERRISEYRLKQFSPPSMVVCLPENVKTQLSSTLKGLRHSIYDLKQPSEEVSCSECGDAPFGLSSKTPGPYLTIKDTVGGLLIEDEKLSTEVCRHVAVGNAKNPMSVKGLWNHPNQLSEEMVRCMKNIFISLADSSIISSKSSPSESLTYSTSPCGQLSSSSLWSLSEPLTISAMEQSPQVDFQSNNEVLATESAYDPYKFRGKLCWTDIGNYGLAIEVSWMSVGKKQLEYAGGALRRFRSLIEQLARVNPLHLSGNEKLAFWINLYNALVMHAYLAYGVPKSDLKLFSLMQKAAYTVGGHQFTAACIEYVILKMKAPVHRPQTALLLALHKLKVSEEQKKFSIETSEPLVAFALSCGMYSSPAVRIYTPTNVREELQEAQRDFIRASVGVSSKGKFLVPKMLHCFARGIVDDANLAIWISRFLPQQQAAFVEHCVSQRRQSFLGSRNCGILPFDSRFRYLFLPKIVP